MFKNLIFLSLINHVNCYIPFLLFPVNINISISEYNSSNCSNEAIKNTEFLIVCQNDTYVDEYRKCCYDEISKLSPINEPNFSNCYDINYNYNNSYYEYECSDSNYINYSYVTITLIIFISLFITFLLSYTNYLIHIHCRKNPYRNYEEIN